MRHFDFSDQCSSLVEHVDHGLYAVSQNVLALEARNGVASESKFSQVRIESTLSIDSTVDLVDPKRRLRCERCLVRPERLEIFDTVRRSRVDETCSRRRGHIGSGNDSADDSIGIGSFTRFERGSIGCREQRRT